MTALSVCMIVKNEEDVIARCLDCIKDIADEIIIVDTGSSDTTKEIVKKYTDHLYDFKWVDDFAAARNFSFSKATKDYIMWLDADDVIDEKNQQALLALKKSLNPSIDVIKMKYDVAFDGNNHPTFSYYRERIFKRSLHFTWVGEIHEVISPRGNIMHCEIAIAHKKLRPNEPERNLKIFEQMILQGKQLDPRQQYYYARELYYNGKTQRAVDQFLQFLLEGKGWVENNISACQTLAYCYYQMNDEDRAVASLFNTFKYDTPRAEICCDIGKHFLDRTAYQMAIFWYGLASEIKMDDQNDGFIMPDCYGFTPYLQLCVCYDRLGNRVMAESFNEKAGEIKPNNPIYLQNKDYFRNQH